MLKKIKDIDQSARSQLAQIAQNWRGTLDAESWTGASAPYSQDVTTAEMTADDIPLVDVDLSDCADYAAEQAMLKDFLLLYRVVSGADKITVYATSVPAGDIGLLIRRG